MKEDALIYEQCKAAGLLIRDKDTFFSVAEDIRLKFKKHYKRLAKENRIGKKERSGKIC